MSHSGSLCVSLGPLSIGASQIPLWIKISVKDSWQPHVQNHHSTFILYREPSSTQMLQRNVRRKYSSPREDTRILTVGAWRLKMVGACHGTFHSVRNKVMFIYSPLLWLLMSPPFQAPFPSNFWIGSHWSCFPCLALPPNQAKWEGKSLPWHRKSFRVRQWVEHQSGTFTVFWIFVLSCALLHVFTHLEYLVFLEQNQMWCFLQPRRNWSLDPTTCGLKREKQFKLGFWEGRARQ